MRVGTGRSGTGRSGTGREAHGRREPEEIGAILGRWIKEHGLVRRLADDGIYRSWSQIVGSDIAAHTRVARLSRGVLTVEVSSAPLLQELSTYCREQILELVRAREEFRGIQEVRFRAGPAPAEEGTRD